MDEEENKSKKYRFYYYNIDSYGRTKMNLSIEVIESSLIHACHLAATYLADTRISWRLRKWEEVKET